MHFIGLFMVLLAVVYTAKQGHLIQRRKAIGILVAISVGLVLVLYREGGS